MTRDLSVRGWAYGGPVFTPGGKSVGVCIASTVPRDAAEMTARANRSRRAPDERKLSGTYVVPATAVRKALAELGRLKN